MVFYYWTESHDFGLILHFIYKHFTFSQCFHAFNVALYQSIIYTFIFHKKTPVGFLIFPGLLNWIRTMVPLLFPDFANWIRMMVPLLLAQFFDELMIFIVVSNFWLAILLPATTDGVFNMYHWNGYLLCESRCFTLIYVDCISIMNHFEKYPATTALELSTIYESLRRFVDWTTPNSRPERW